MAFAKATHLPPVLSIHAAGERDEMCRRIVTLKAPPVFEPQRVRKVEQGHHGHDARGQKAVDLLVVVVYRRLSCRVIWWE